MRFADDQSKQDSDSQDEQDAIVDNVNVRKNATINENAESGQIAAKVFDADYKEAAVLV